MAASNESISEHSMNTSRAYNTPRSVENRLLNPWPPRPTVPTVSPVQNYASIAELKQHHGLTCQEEM